MTAELALICRACRQPIEGDTGALRATYAAINSVRAAEAEWAERQGDRAISITELMLAPEPVPWLPYHDRCDPEFESASYQIDSAQLSTWRHLARWTAHLMSKNWFPFSDWDELLREAAGEVPATRIQVLERQP